MCNLPSSMKSSSHKTWQISPLFLKPLQIQNLKEKKWGDMAYYIPPPEKVGEHVPRVPHQIAPILITAKIKNWGSVTSKHLSNRNHSGDEIRNVNQRYYVAVNPHWTIVPLLEHVVGKQ